MSMKVKSSNSKQDEHMTFLTRSLVMSLTMCLSSFVRVEIFRSLELSMTTLLMNFLESIILTFFRKMNTSSMPKSLEWKKRRWKTYQNFAHQMMHSLQPKLLQKLQKLQGNEGQKLKPLPKLLPKLLQNNYGL